MFPAQVEITAQQPLVRVEAQHLIPIHGLILKHHKPQPDYQPEPTQLPLEMQIVVLQLPVLQLVNHRHYLSAFQKQMFSVMAVVQEVLRQILRVVLPVIHTHGAIARQLKLFQG